MPSAEGPLLHRRRLGVELRRLRADRTLDDVAAATLISTSKLSRLENGQGVPHPRDIRDLVNYYELDAQSADRLRRWASAGRTQAWWQEFSTSLPAGGGIYLDYESAASTIRMFANSIVPPLLQTVSYARLLYEVLPMVNSREDAERLGIVRARRQKLLVESDDAPHLIVTLDEAVLRRTFGSSDDFREQLEYLLLVSRRPNVSLQVVPFSAGLHAGLPGHFVILQYADDGDRDVVTVELHTGERYFERPSDVLDHLRIFDAITLKALDHSDSRKLIADIRDSA